MSEDRSEERGSSAPSIKDRILGALQDAADWMGDALDGLIAPQPELVPIPIPVRRPTDRRR